jgi:hypothetical protein
VCTIANERTSLSEGGEMMNNAATWSRRAGGMGRPGSGREHGWAQGGGGDGGWDTDGHTRPEAQFRYWACEGRSAIGLPAYPNG